MPASPSQRRSRILKSQYESLKVQLHVIRSFMATREGSCCVCGFPGHVAGLMIIPGLPGHFCCIECVECSLFGPGRCRWCSFALAPTQSSFCCDYCRTSNESSPFGSGKRFALWLSRHEPRLFADLVGREVPTGVACLQCGDGLHGKRLDSLFCNSTCQHKFNRSRNRPAKSKEEDYLGQWPIPDVHTGLSVSEVVYQK
jgi:hypothetical protein